jgi:hypothetical protein
MRIESEDAMPKGCFKDEAHIAATVIAKKGNISTTQLHDAMIVIRDYKTDAMLGEARTLQKHSTMGMRYDALSLRSKSHKISVDAPFLNFASRPAFALKCFSKHLPTSRYQSAQTS